MSALHASIDGQYLKTLLPFSGKQIYGMHKAFGLIAERSVQEKLQAMKRKGALPSSKGWLYRFEIDWSDKQPKLRPIDGCDIAQDKNAWLVNAAYKTWKFAVGDTGVIAAEDFATKDSRNEKWLTWLLLIAFLFVVSFIVLWKPQEKPVEEEVIEPITVVVKQERTVTVSAPQQSVVQPEVKPKEVKRAVPQELGFLGLVGKKDLTKAVGGAQLDLKASAGAGRGGSEGSGGEVLSGLGKGVRATTVGNTGVAGLGGVGTKGKGGGLGGYGDVAIASGEGRGISAIAVSQGVGVDGGLDRHVIQATIAKYLNQVRACYEDRLRQNPGLEGTLTMDFQIGANGMLNFSKVKSNSVGDAQVGQCVSQKMMGWEFPKPRGGVNVNVTYPFTLRPVSR